ncbi:MAG: DUF1775 domain-containing protein [Mycobacterium sp.]
MTSIARAVAHGVITTAVVACLYAGSATAVAEVLVNADNAVRGEEAVLTFRVPGKADTRALTTQVSVALPDVAAATTEPMPGWTSRLDRDNATGTVRAVTWTAATGVGIEAGQFGLFRVTVTLPKAPKLSFAVTQNYSDGTVVHWDQPPLPGADPEHPRPTLTLASGPPDEGVPASSASSRATSDIIARGLAGAVLLVGAIATGVWMSAWRRV